MIEIQEGQTIPLKLKLFDNKSDKFIRCTFYNENLTSNSVYLLNHVGNGLYHCGLNLIAPGFYHAIFEVFNDSVYNKKDTSYSDSEETYSVRRTDALITESRDFIADKIDDNDGRIATY